MRVTYPGVTFVAGELSVEYALLLCSFWGTPWLLQDFQYIQALNVLDIVLFRKWYEYISDEAMNAIEDHRWVGDWIYANVWCPVRAMEAKRLENGLSCNAAIFADSNDTKSDVFQTTPTFQAVSK